MKFWMFLKEVSSIGKGERERERGKEKGILNHAYETQRTTLDGLLE